MPVKAIGARALLDYPDEISFTSAPVKVAILYTMFDCYDVLFIHCIFIHFQYCSTKTILMRNIGNAEAKFTMEADQAFSVTPSTTILPVNSSVQVTISFTPKKVGEHDGELVLLYDTGEKVYTKLYGSAIDVNVRLDRSSVTVDNAYIGLFSQGLVVSQSMWHPPVSLEVFHAVP